MAPAQDSEFLLEIWGLYSLGTLWIVLRFAVRLRTDGIKGLRLDDALAFIALCAWTYTCAIIEITYHTGTNTDFSPAEIAKFDQKKYDEVLYGSKLFLGSWYA
jgi:thiamine pyrophosphokinase